MKRSADVVIVGGGVMGTSIALHLALRKAGRILLCERRFIGSGPSGRSSALLRRHWSLELYARMAAKSFEVYTHFADLTGRRAEITHCGMLQLIGPEDLRAMHATVAMLRRIGIHVEAPGPDDLRGLLPPLNGEGVAGAIYDPDAGYADPTGVMNGYAARARELGVHILQGLTATRIQTRAGRVTGVETDQGSVETPAVVNAAGVYAGRLAETAGVELPIAPCRVQMATFRVPPEFGRPRPIVGDQVQRSYFRPEGADWLMVGTSGGPNAHPPVDPDALDERVDPEYQLRAAEALVHRFPVMQEGQATGGFASMYDMTPDVHFILEADPRVPGLFTAAGFSGHGFKHSPVVGRIMADLVCDGKTGEFDISPFSSMRFADGRPPWRGPYKNSVL
jgi:sarcosine oxidase subunit beta